MMGVDGKASEVGGCVWPKLRWWQRLEIALGSLGQPSPIKSWQWSPYSSSGLQKPQGRSQHLGDVRRNRKNKTAALCQHHPQTSQLLWGNIRSWTKVMVITSSFLFGWKGCLKQKHWSGASFWQEPWVCGWADTLQHLLLARRQKCSTWHGRKAWRTLVCFSLEKKERVQLNKRPVVLRSARGKIKERSWQKPFKG